MPPSSGRAAFVTGGTGFVGLNMVKELMIRGWDVTALHRPSSDLKLLKRFRPKLAVGELSDPGSLHAAKCGLQLSRELALDHHLVTANVDNIQHGLILHRADLHASAAGGARPRSFC